MAFPFEKNIVKIDDVNIFGKGVCRIDNKVIFVDNALSKEVCEIKLTHTEKSYSYAKTLQLIEKSDKRVAPLCEHFGKCGGCTFLHTTLDNENEIKREYVKRSFKKQGIEVEIEDVCAPVEWEYRNKIVLFYNGHSFGYNQSNSNLIVPHKRCLLNDEIFDSIANESSNLLKNSGIRAICLRKSTENEISLCLIFGKEYKMLDEYIAKIVAKFPIIKNVYYSICDDEDVVFEKQHLILAYGEGYIYDSLCGLKFRISPESFYQINHKCAEKLYKKVVELANLDKNQRCADLFCGTGTIGIICAKETGATVYGVEINKKAVFDAKFNGRLNNVESICFEAEDASRFNENVDVAIIDPPRKGLSKFMINTLTRLKPKKIVYVSCNVDTQARDIKSLLNEYKITHPVSLFNMFPKTSHVESVVCLTRK